MLAIDDAGEVGPPAIVAALRARGHRRILSEAGPHLFASLVAAGLVDELFLTVSPLLLGRGPEPRLGLVAGDPPAPPALRLEGLRRDATHLFLRYRFA